jgi:DnaK suppressor protein
MKTEPLTSSQRHVLRHALEADRERIRRDLERLQEQADEDRVDSAEVEDIAEGVIEDRDRAAIEEHDRALLGEIEHALAKMADKSYGYSEASGRPIPFERLRAVPWARYDTDEAERVEHS